MSVPRRPRVSTLLIEEPPLTVRPTLAVLLGLNEAIFVQQVQYWCHKSKHIHDGHVWVYNTIEQWHEQFPFWGTATIFRVVKSLRARGVLLTSSTYNKMATDRTLWYAIDHDALDAIFDLSLAQSPSDQSDEMESSPAQDGGDHSDYVLPESTPETIAENTQENPPAARAASPKGEARASILSESEREARIAAIRARTLTAKQQERLGRA